MRVPGRPRIPRHIHHGAYTPLSRCLAPVALLVALVVPGQSGAVQAAQRANTTARSILSTPGVLKLKGTVNPATLPAVSMAQPLATTGAPPTARVSSRHRPLHPKSAASTVRGPLDAAPLAVQDSSFAAQSVNPDATGSGTYLTAEGADAASNATLNAVAGLEPPDGNICAGVHGALEVVNVVGEVFGNTTLSLKQGPFSLNQFFLEAPTAFISDPRCAYDPAAKAFYATIWETTTNPDGSVAESHIDLAVDPTSDPLASWTVFQIDTTSASAANCPCLPDYTMLGFDHYGVYLSSNLFGTVNYAGAQLFLMSKQQLLAAAQGTLGTGLVFFATPAGALPNDYTIMPNRSYDATSSANLGTEYFAESLDPLGMGGNQIAIFALLNEAGMDHGLPPAIVTNVVTVNPYSIPPNADQEGFYGQLNTDDDGVQQVTTNKGTIWLTLDTGLTFASDPVTRSGVLWVNVLPSVTSSGVSATVLNQGYIGAPNNFLMYPGLAFNGNGNGAMVLSRTSDYGGAYATLGNQYPSVAVAYGPGFGVVKNVTSGAAPFIGFTCVELGVCRWGDYAGATYDPDSNSVLLEEVYVPGLAAPFTISNWGTRLIRFAP